MPDIGTYYTLPVIPSFAGIDAQINKGFGEKLGLASKKAGKAMGQNIADGVKQAEAAVKASTDKIVALQDKQADAADKVRLAEEKLNEARQKGVTGSRLTAAQNAREKALRAEAAAIRSVEAETRSLERAQNSLVDAQKNSGKGGKSAGGEFLSGFADGISGLGAKAGPIGAALTAAAGVALAGGLIIGKNVMAGMEQEQQRANVQAKLGVDDATMKRIGAAAGKAYAGNFGESAAGNLEAARVAIQGGLVPSGNDPGLQRVIEQLETVNGLIGGDLQSTTKAVSVLMRNGLAPTAEDAFDIIVKGFQKSGDLGGDLIDSISEYSAGWKNTGLSAQQSLALIQQSVDMGVDNTDRGADALREFGRRVTEEGPKMVTALNNIGLNGEQMYAAFKKGGPDAFTAFDEAFDKIRSIQDPVARNTAAMALLGDTAGDFIGTFAQWDPSAAVEKFGSVQGAAQKVADTVGGTGASAFESAQRKIEVAVSGMQDQLANAFGPSLNELSTWVTDHQDEIVGFFTEAAEVGAEFSGVIIGGVGGITSGFGYMVEGIGDGIGFALDALENLAKGAATVADALGQHGMADSLRSAQEALGRWSDDAHGAGETIVAFGDGISGAGKKIFDFNASMSGIGSSAQNAASQLDGVKTAMANLPNGKDIDINAIVVFRDLNGNAIDPSQLITPIRMAATPGGTAPRIGGGRAKGGVLPGYSPGVDNMLVPMSGGEGVIVPPVMRKLGPAWLAALNSGRGYAEGGVVGADVDVAQSLVGTPYSQAARNDCSGMVARVISRATGTPETGLMTTKNAQEWLAARGFKAGTGGPGMISVGWYNHGSGTNDGHMAMTLSDGTNAESGGSHGEFLIGSGAKGADDPQFDQHMYLPTLFGEGAAGGASSPYSASSTGGSYTPPDAKAVREANQKVTDADTRVAQAESKQKELKADAKQSEKDKAQADVDKAKREAKDARDDLGEVMKGKFTPGKGGKSGQGGLGQFGELGSIAGSFFKETLGFDGSFLPDFSSLGIVQTGSNLLNAFKGPMQGLVDGGLGIQQPGWSPGMPVNGVANDTGIGTSDSPFGLSQTALPGIADMTHPGSGAAPGPVSIDNSTHINSPTGDPADIEKRIRTTNMNRPRIDSYAMPGS